MFLASEYDQIGKYGPGNFACSVISFLIDSNIIVVFSESGRRLKSAAAIKECKENVVFYVKRYVEND